MFKLNQRLQGPEIKDRNRILECLAAGGVLTHPYNPYGWWQLRQGMIPVGQVHSSIVNALGNEKLIERESGVSAVITDAGRAQCSSKPVSV